ncbi:MAG: hypothetical protein H0U74_05760 [Bradymonadaceae bacterium]|nr:hypothetical protein [Lujinxingiaceae bacterium]
MLVDVHAKSSLSEGVTLSADQVIQRAREVGLDAIAFCETRNTARCQEILDAAAKYDDIAVFIGVEIPTEKGLLLGFVPEIDDFYNGEEWRALTDVTIPSPEAVIALFESKNGAVIAARPYDLDIPFNMGDFIFSFEHIKGVEVFNPRVGEIQNNFALEAAASMGLSTVGGSDPTNSLDVIGQYATFFDSDLKTQRQFVEALRASEFWAVQIGDANPKKSSRTERAERASSGRSSGGASRDGGGRSGGAGRDGGGRSGGGGRDGGGRSGGGRSGGKSGAGRSGNRS